MLSETVKIGLYKHAYILQVSSFEDIHYKFNPTVMGWQPNFKISHNPKIYAHICLLSVTEEICCFVIGARWPITCTGLHLDIVVY